ncbi:hypothetical protein LTR64_007078 [Lithohypha guttulata]
MSIIYNPHRNHQRSYGNFHRGLTPWSRAPTSFTASPWGWGVEPFSFNEPFHAPFQSLFNDTFSQLERLTGEMNSHLNDAFGGGEGEGNVWQKMLTNTPKFDVKETEDAYVLEGELPGVAKSDISLNFVDDNTLVLKTKTETFREQKPAQQADSTTKQPDTSSQDTRMTGANPDATTSSTTENGTSNSDSNDKTVTTTTNNQTKDVAAPAQPTYHLTERTYGSFQRAFSFPAEVKHEDVKARLNNGVLTVTVPKVQKTAETEKKGRSVTVEDVKEDENIVPEAEMSGEEKEKEKEQKANLEDNE